MYKTVHSVDCRNEIWLPVVGLEHVYSISSCGRLRRELTTQASKAGRILQGQIRTPEHSNTAYLMYLMSHDGKTVSKFAHRLVIEAFIGFKSDMVVHHKDNNGLNNCINNLEWVTHRQNIEFAYRDGMIKSLRGERVPCSKLTPETIALIEADRKNGMYFKDLAVKYGVHKSNICRAVNRKTWKHLA